MAEQEKAAAETQEIVDDAAQPEAGVEQVESISLVDLNSLAQIIDLASSRGAFRGQELEPIGALYNKLTKFLASVKAAQDEAAGSEEGGEAPEAEAPAGE
tara:strand:+ start:1445 stop:1744 length:300 start_codon:yes stop_codon:yes gene_type:complete